MDKEIKRQQEEAWIHIQPYMNNSPQAADLTEMCSYCEAYCGKEHDYAECRDKMCFKFWLSYVYLNWMNAFKGGY